MSEQPTRLTATLGATSVSDGRGDLTARVTARLTELDITHSGSLTPSQFRDIIAAIAPELQDAERRLREAEARVDSPFICKAGNQQHPDPADCDWPLCGCDEKASRVMQHLQESGHLIDPRWVK